MRTFRNVVVRAVVIGIMTISAGMGAAALWSPLAEAAGTTLWVSTTGHDTGNCQTQSAPCASVGYALSQAPSGATIMVGPGTFVEATLMLTQPVTIEAAGTLPWHKTIIDASKVNPNCGPNDGAVEVISLGGCSLGPAAAAGSYTISGVTLEGVPGAAGSATVEPFIVKADGLDPNVSITLNDDNLLTNSTLDPNSGIDGPVGFYTYSGYSTDSATFTNDTFSGLSQGVFPEDYPGALHVSDNTFQQMIPVTVGASTYSPIGVFILADEDSSGTDTSGYTVTGNTFDGYAGYGVVAQAGYPGYGPYPSTIENVTISHNVFWLPVRADSEAGSSAVISLTAGTGGADTIENVAITHNTIITTSGDGLKGIDVQITSGNPSNPMSGIVVNYDNLLGGHSVIGISNAAPISVDGTHDFWGSFFGPGSPGATTVATSNGGSVTTSPSSPWPVF